MLIGWILPDLVDKVPGRIVFISSLDNGRIFFQSLIIVMLFFLTGLIVWKYFRSFAFLVTGFWSAPAPAGGFDVDEPGILVLPVFGTFPG